MCDPEQRRPGTDRPALERRLAVAAPPVRAVVAAMLALLLGGCTGLTGGGGPDPAESLPSGVVPMQVYDSGPSTLALVPVTIAGQGPYYFALDTGASVSVVDADVADQLGLPETGRQRPVIGVIGNQDVTMVRIDRWAAGDVPLDGAGVARLDLPDAEVAPGRQLQGLLGSDVLSDYGSVLIDYARQQLRLGPA